MDPIWETALDSTPPHFTYISVFADSIARLLHFNENFMGPKNFSHEVHLLHPTSKAVDVFCIIAPATNQLANKCPNEIATD